VLVWDNHPILTRRLVKAFLARQPRLHAVHCPAYAPELTPWRGICTPGKESTACSAPHIIQELHRRVLSALKRVAHSQPPCLSGPVFAAPRCLGRSDPRQHSSFNGQ
jgi:hypothetical protein